MIIVYVVIIAGPKSKTACQGREQQQFSIHSPACGRRREKCTELAEKAANLKMFKVARSLRPQSAVVYTGVSVRTVPRF